jgi:hypothetical protein
LGVFFCHRRRRPSEAARRVSFSSFSVFRFPCLTFWVLCRTLLIGIIGVFFLLIQCSFFALLIPTPSILFDRLHTLLYPSGSHPCACNIPRSPVLILELYTYPLSLRCCGLACIPSIFLFNQNVVFIQLRPFFDSLSSR